MSNHAELSGRVVQGAGESYQDALIDSLKRAARLVESMHGKQGVLVTLVARFPNDVERELVLSCDPDLLGVVDVLVRRQRVEIEAARAVAGTQPA